MIILSYIITLHMQNQLPELHVCKHIASLIGSGNLCVYGIYEHILGLQSLPHGFTDPFQSGEALLYVVQMQILLLFGHLPVLHIWVQASHKPSAACMQLASCGLSWLRTIMVQTFWTRRPT